MVPWWKPALLWLLRSSTPRYKESCSGWHLVLWHPHLLFHSRQSLSSNKMEHLWRKYLTFGIMWSRKYLMAPPLRWWSHPQLLLAPRTSMSTWFFFHCCGSETPPWEKKTLKNNNYTKTKKFCTCNLEKSLVLGPKNIVPAIGSGNLMKTNSVSTSKFSEKLWSSIFLTKCGAPRKMVWFKNISSNSFSVFPPLS